MPKSEILTRLSSHTRMFRQARSRCTTLRLDRNSCKDNVKCSEIWTPFRTGVLISEVSRLIGTLFGTEKCRPFYQGVLISWCKGSSALTVNLKATNSEDLEQDIMQYNQSHVFIYHSGSYLACETQQIFPSQFFVFCVIFSVLSLYVSCCLLKVGTLWLRCF